MRKFLYIKLARSRFRGVCQQRLRKLKTITLRDLYHFVGCDNTSPMTPRSLWYPRPLIREILIIVYIVCVCVLSVNVSETKNPYFSHRTKYCCGCRDQFTCTKNMAINPPHSRGANLYNCYPGLFCIGAEVKKLFKKRIKCFRF